LPVLKDKHKQKTYKDAVKACNLSNQQCEEENQRECYNCAYRCKVASDVFPNYALLAYIEFCRKQIESHMEKFPQTITPTPSPTAIPTSPPSPAVIQDELRRRKGFK